MKARDLGLLILRPMSKTKRSSSKRKPATRRRASTERTLDEWLVQVAAPLQQEIAGVIVAALGAASLLALSGVAGGDVGHSWTQVLQQLLGWGSWVVSLTVVLAGVHMALRSIGRPWRITVGQVIGFEIVFAASLAITHLASATEEQAALALAAAGQGGGYIGWALSMPIVEGLGSMVAWMALTAAWFLGAGLMLRVSHTDVQEWAIDRSGKLQRWADGIRKDEGTSSAKPPGKAPSGGRRAKPARAKPVRKPPRSPASRPSTAPHKLVIARPPSSTKRRAPARPSHLPPLDLLKPGVAVEQDEAEIAQKAEVIEKTLLDFGLPVRVVEVRRGPVVTQFGVAPQYIEKPGAHGQIREQKVRVSQITALTNDLALALAASRIRLEAPVPGRPIVGIEVPNESISLVHLRQVMDSQPFHKLKAPLGIALGLDVSGAPVVTDLQEMPHILIGGTTGSGKSVCISAITTCLVCNNTPDELRLVMIDPKMVELVRFNGLPHLLGTAEVEMDRILGVLHWLTREMDERYKILADAGARTLTDYNRVAGRRKKHSKLPHIVLLVDELADLMMMAPEIVEQTLVRLAQMARAVGIHLVVATQRPSTDVVTGLIKANFPARIAFAVATSTDSRVILDSTGAESLLGKGDMLFQAPDAAKPVRLQGCYASDLELDRVIAFWRDQAGEEESGESAAPWEDLVVRKAKMRDKDDLLERAIALAKEGTTISTSLIQRRLRIGYPRAGRLMDTLEEMGVVGEEQSGGRTRTVLIQEDTDPPDDNPEAAGS